MMSQRQHKYLEEIFVVKQLKHNLSGLPTINAIYLLVVVDNVGNDLAGSIKQQFPGLLTEMGTVQGDCVIKLQPDAKPFSLGTARNKQELNDKVKQELNDMEAQGVISKVQKPTQWCAGMVIVNKSQEE